MGTRMRIRIASFWRATLRWDCDDQCRCCEECMAHVAQPNRPPNALATRVRSRRRTDHKPYLTSLKIQPSALDSALALPDFAISLRMFVFANIARRETGR